MNVGEKIKYLRKKKGITVEQLANSIGKNKATVYRYENGDIENLPYSVIIPIAKALGVLPTYFFEYKDDLMVKSVIDNEQFRVELKSWINEVKCVDFTDDELKKIMEYAKFILSQRSVSNE